MPAYTTPSGALITDHLEFLALRSTGNSILKITLAGVKIEIRCEHAHVDGWILGTLGLALAHYLKCTMPKPAESGCLVHNELIFMHMHSLLLLNGSGYKIFFVPKGGNFTEVTVDGCTNTGLNGTFPVEGSVAALANNTTLELEFHRESGGELTVGGNAATYEDKIKPLMVVSGSGGFMVEDGSSTTMPAYTTSSGALITDHLEFLALRNIGNSVLKSTLAGVKIEIACAHVHIDGWILGTLGLALAHYLKCTMPKPSEGGCLVHNNLISVHAHTSLLLNDSGGYEVLFAPESGNFTEIIIDGCTNTGLNGTFPVEGSVAALANNNTLELEFHKESGDQLVFAGNHATYEDKIKPVMVGSIEDAEGIMVEDGS
jgi:hypothetical protein